MTERGAAGPALLAALLVFSQVGLGVAVWRSASQEHTIYVMTPMVDVVPGGNPLDREEAQALVADVRHQADARDMQSAYAWLGSTLSLDDLLRGVESLDAAGAPLTAAQAVEVKAILDRAAQDHARIRQVQVEALDAELQIQTEIAAIADLLPEEQAQRVRGVAGARPKGEPPGARPAGGRLAPGGAPPGASPPGPGPALGVPSAPMGPPPEHKP